MALKDIQTTDDNVCDSILTLNESSICCTSNSNCDCETRIQLLNDDDNSSDGYLDSEIDDAWDDNLAGENETRTFHLPPRGKSSFSQSVINTVNLLVGVCVISLPFVFKTSGWLLGSGFVLLGAMATLYTTFLMIQCMRLDPKLSSLGDLGEKSFGKWGRWIISSFYVFELTSCSVSYVIIVGDTLHQIFPSVPTENLKLLIVCIMIASNWIDSLSVLSIASSLGIAASVATVLITFYDGLSTKMSPGSLWQPAETSWIVLDDPAMLLQNLGLVIYAYSGHSVFPSIYKDMRRPEKFNDMILISYAIVVMVWFLALPTAVYLMFGNQVAEEYTFNLWNHDLYDKSVNGFLLWLFIILPTAKYALLMNPVAHVFESMFQSKHPRYFKFSRLSLKIFIRTILGLLVLWIATMFPHFANMLGFIGSLFSFFITIVFPCACHYALLRHRASKWLNGVNLAMASLGVVLGLATSIGCYLKTTQF